jgi:predicted NAD/FAD-dependent oxidoreductase
MRGVVVVGGGISGVACATVLAEAGHDVDLRERSHLLGGRLASRTLRATGTAFDGRVVDIGASYFTASHPQFAAAIDRLVEAGVVRPWTRAFHVAGPAGMEGISMGPMRFAAPAGLRSVVAAMAAGLEHISTSAAVERVALTDGGVSVDSEPRAAVALCMPGPQAVRVSADVPVSPIPWDAVIAVTCVFPRRQWAEFDGVFVNDDPVVTWIADDGSRRGDAAPVLVAHVHPDLSARHLSDPAAVVPQTVAALRRVLGISAEPAWVDVHRWSFAKPLVGSEEPCWLHADQNLGLAGDAWAGGPRVEAAWLSGRHLGTALAARL